MNHEHDVTDVSDVTDEMRAMLLAQLTNAHDAVRALGGTYEMRAPTVVVCAQNRVGDALEVIWYGHFRVGHYAQSGSDWNQHEVVFKTTTFAADGSIASERTHGQRTVNVSEYDENDYDDDREAESVVSAIMKG